MSTPFIANVEIFPVKPHNGHVGFVSLVIIITESLKYSLANIALYTRPGGGYRLVFPSKSLPSGKEIPCICPLTQEAGYFLEQAIVKKMDDLAFKSKRKKDVMTTLQQREDTNANDAGRL